MKPCLLASAALFLGTAALADVTPEDVWADWQAQADRWDQRIAAEETRHDGDTLVLTGVTIHQDKDGTRLDGRIDEVRMQAQGGDVRITSSDSYPMTVVSTPPATPEDPAPEPVTAQMLMTQQGVVTVASGDPGAVGYAVTGDQIGVQMTGVTEADGTAVPMTMTMAINGIDARYADGDRFEAEGTAENVLFQMTSEEPAMSMDYDLERVSLTSSGERTTGPMPFLGQMALAHESSTYRFDGSDATGTTRASGRTGTGTLNVDLTEGQATYDSQTQDTTLRLESSTLPGPLDLNARHALMRMTVPVPDSDIVAFDAALDLSGVTATEETWALFDPTGALPRDPAHLRLAMHGSGEGPDAPMNLVLENLDLAIAGAQLTGSGQSTIDPGASAEVNPMAAFGRGKVDLTLRGGNALIDRLVASGLLPAQQEMAARMTLGAFGRAVPGEQDTITSTVQFGNGITVNGIPLQ